MDFGVVGLDGLVGSSTSASHESAFASLPTSDPDHHTKHKWCDDWRSFKSMKTDDFSTSTSNKSMLFCDTQQTHNMLSFSSPKQEAVFLKNDGLTLPYFQHTQPTSTSAYGRHTGFGVGGIHGVRGPFTPSQWMELEHQALIYKYITANAPIPSNLLIPIRKALDSAGLPCFSGGPLRPNTLGWGAFHLGFAGNTDPEPGRCRRTDGKKWRCSRDAVADQKYCERHMNRGRHRSRKPVEGQTGHSVAGTTTTAATANPKMIPMVGPAVVSGSVASNIAQHQLQRGASIPSAATSLVVRALTNKDNAGEGLHDSRGFSILSPTINLSSKENTFSVPKQQNPYEQTPRTEFGLVPTDFLLNASNKSASFVVTPNRDTESQHSLRHFMDVWPKNQLDLQSERSERTQLSISIPVNSSENLALSPLRLSREFDPVQMGRGVGSALNESTQRQASWIPISWEDSVGGPLGEVLQNTNNNNAEQKSLSGLNLMTDAWDGSPRLGSSSVSSPTGVLQKTAFGSVSNSSAGSSPRAENNKTHEGASLCDDLLGSTLKKSSSL